MKEKVVHVICCVLMVLPFTLLVFRQNAWTLESPMAECLILSYASIMILGAAFSWIMYGVGNVKDTLMKFFCALHSIYGVTGAGIILLYLTQKK